MKIVNYLAAGAALLLLGACSSGSKTEAKDSAATDTASEQVVGFIEDMPSSDSTGVISTGDGVAVENN